MKTDVEKKVNKKIFFIIGGIVIGVVIVILAIFLINSYNTQEKYIEAVEMYNEKQYEQAVAAFSTLNTYKDSTLYLDKCYIGAGDIFIEEKNYESAKAEYNKIQDASQKNEMLNKCNFAQAIDLFEQKKYSEASVLLETLGEYNDSVSYLDKCYIAIGDSLIKDGSYEKAQIEYNKINDTVQKAEMLKKCDYSKAVKLFNNKKYKEAQTVFETLGKYNDSSSYVEKCKVELKYVKFDYFGNSEMYSDFYFIYGEGEKIKNSAAAENKFSFMYGTWYDENDKKIEITPTHFNGKEYGVCAVSGRCALIYLYENENSMFAFTNYDDSIFGEKLSCAEFPSLDNMILYSSVTKAEYDKAYTEWQEEQQAKVPSYSDSEIINLATKKAQDKLSSAYRNAGYSGSEMLYHSFEVESSSVSYDWTTRTYTCYLSVVYMTNIFDFWGTSTDYYDVVATYEDTGAGLSSVGFYIN